MGQGVIHNFAFALAFIYLVGACCYTCMLRFQAWHVLMLGCINTNNSSLTFAFTLWVHVGLIACYYYSPTQDSLLVGPMKPRT